MLTGTSLLLRSPGPASLRPALLLTHVRAAFSLMTGGSGQSPARSVALLAPTQFPLGLPWLAPASRTHFLKSHLLGTPPSLHGGHGTRHHPPPGRVPA